MPLPGFSHPSSIAVIGAGHVGVPHAVMLAKKCPEVRVTIFDDDPHKVAAWNSSLLPFYEPGLYECLASLNNVSFTSDLPAVIEQADIILVSVSTPIKSDGTGAGYAPDLVHWETVARRIAAVATTPKIIVERSTVPVKTADLMASVLAANSGGQQWTVLSNPEFAREGLAMIDHASPERVMIGKPASEAGSAAAEALASLYRQWVPESKVIISGLWSAELSKMTANAFLAQRISSINSISALCERTGADVSEVSHAIGIDSRIGRQSLQASVGFGGACYETHLRNLIYLCRHYRLKEVATYWESVLSMNSFQKRRFAMQIVSSMFNTISGKKIAVLGYAYKKNTSDTRNSPATDVCRALLAEKANLAIYDPHVAEEAIHVALTDTAGVERLLVVERDAYIATSSAHALVVLTDWDEFTRLDYQRVYDSMQKPAFVFDGRNVLDHDALRRIGFQVYGIGKPPPRNEEQEREEQDRADRERISATARVRVGAAKLNEYAEGVLTPSASSPISAPSPEAPAMPTPPPAPPL